MRTAGGTVMRVGSLFTGYGGLDLAVESTMNARTVWTCENDPGASKIIARRFPRVPNLGDVTAVDWATVRPVDVLTAGWPCQPFSNAGKKLGADDDRALWPYVADAVRVVRPRFVVLENVPAIARVGELARAVGSLAALGYLGGWLRLRAADVGAPHERARIFVVARDSKRRRQHGRRWDVAETQGRSKFADDDRPAADARRVARDTGRRGQSGSAGEDDESAGWPGPEQRCRVFGQYAPAVARWEMIMARRAPHPTADAPRGGRQRLAVPFVEWMMGLPAGWVDDVGLSRPEAMRALGNGVVPQQAAHAIRELLP